MKISAPLGIALSFIFVIFAIFMEGVSFKSFFHFPALVLIVGGTFGVTLASYGWKSLAQSIEILKRSMQESPTDFYLSLFLRFWERARKDGLLSLEEEARKQTDPLLQKGIQHIVDGSDPKTLEEILVEVHEEEEAKEIQSAKIWESASGFSPTIGIIGTVLGLVTVLENLEGGTRVLGQGIATAFVATFYGIVLANLALLPVANHIRQWSSDQTKRRTLIIRGLLSLQSGESRRLLSERIEPYLK